MKNQLEVMQIQLRAMQTELNKMRADHEAQLAPIDDRIRLQLNTIKKMIEVSDQLNVLENSHDIGVNVKCLTMNI